jgi:geranylgeranyl diphosphate synthase, type I
MTKASTETPPFLAAIASRVDVRISELLEAELARWADLDPALAEPLSSLGDLVRAGGKRLRPAFCHWAYVGAGGDPHDAAIVDAGAALELLHTCALIHDDVIDGSTLRHGQHTIHIDYEARHALAHWRGEPRRFGEGVAILVGDIAFVYADAFLTGAPVVAREIFTELRLEVNAGQYLDLIGTARADVSPEAARRICRYKSGKYTIERPLHLGAALLGDDTLERLIGPLSAYGSPLGEAFQLKDDLLDAFGDPALTGKPVGSDLREGKPTYLFALARRSAEGPALRLLTERYGAADLTNVEVAELQSVLEDTGARAATERLVDELVGSAIGAAANAPITAEARAALGDLAHFVAGRDH